MANEVLNILTSLCITISILIMLVLCLRYPLRRWSGANLAYQSWMLLPVAMLAMLLPRPHPFAQQDVSLPPVPGAYEKTATLLNHATSVWPQCIVSVWCAGMLASLLWFVLQHRWFMRSLGKLTAHNNIYLSEYSHTGPAMTGVWRPRIILPADFYQRYTGEEQMLVLRHEQIHLQRRDVCMNTLFALAQCLFWFNPLIHVAGRCFRLDQELACDALVIRHAPESRRTYAEAMLKTQLNLSTAILACHWQSHHPLKERIMHLSQKYPSRVRRMCAYVLLTGVTAASAYNAWAHSPNIEGASVANTQAAAAGSYMLKTTIKVDGKTFTPHIMAKPGEEAKVAIDGATEKWDFNFIVTAAKEDKPGLAMIYVAVSRDGALLAKPRLMVELDREARMQKEEPTHKDDFDITLVASLVK